MKYKTTESLLGIVPKQKYDIDEADNGNIMEFAKMGILFDMIREKVRTKISSFEGTRKDELLNIYSLSVNSVKTAIEYRNKANDLDKHNEDYVETLFDLEKQYNMLSGKLGEVLARLHVIIIGEIPDFEHNELLIDALVSRIFGDNERELIMGKEDDLIWILDRMLAVIDVTKSLKGVENNEVFMDLEEKKDLIDLLERTKLMIELSLDLSFDYYKTRYCFMTNQLLTCLKTLRQNGYGFYLTKPGQEIKTIYLYNIIATCNVLNNDLDLEMTNNPNLKFPELYMKNYYIMKRLMQFKNFFSEDSSTINLSDEINLVKIKDTFFEATKLSSIHSRTASRDEYYFKNPYNFDLSVTENYKLLNLFYIEDKNLNDVHERIHNLTYRAAQGDIKNEDVLDLFKLLFTFILLEFNYRSNRKYLTVCHFAINRIISSKKLITDFSNKKAYEFMPKDYIKTLEKEGDKHVNMTVPEYLHQMYRDIVFPYMGTVMKEIFENNPTKMYTEGSMNYFSFIDAQITSSCITSNLKFYKNTSLISDVMSIDKKRYKIIEGLFDDEKQIKIGDREQNTTNPDQLSEVVIMKRDDWKQLRDLYLEMKSEIQPLMETYESCTEFQEAFEEILLNEKFIQ